jgi:hypothetical protein
MFEEAFVVVPRLLDGTFREAREICGIGDGLAAAALRGFGEQSEIEALDRFAALGGQLSANAAFVFQPGNFVTARASEVANPLLAFFLNLGIVHERSIRI